MQNKPEMKKMCMQDTEILDKLKYNQQGLIPAIVQDYKNGDVLMLAYMNKDSLQKTIDTGLATYWSRSRKCYWVKGETSGHFQKIQQIYFDCDYDTLLLKIEQIGAACHTGQRSCFYRKLLKD